MKCKICGEEINLTIFGCPEDVCWDCLNKEIKGKVLDKNIEGIDYDNTDMG